MYFLLKNRTFARLLFTNLLELVKDYQFLGYDLVLKKRFYPHRHGYKLEIINCYATVKKSKRYRILKQ